MSNNLEKEDILKELIDPDAPTEANHLIDDAQTQTVIMGAILAENELCELAEQVLPPTAFIDKYTQAIASIVIEHWKRYKAIPSEYVIKNELKRRMNTQKDMVVATAKLLEYYSLYASGLYRMEYLRDRIVNYAKSAVVRKGWKDFLDANKAGKPIDEAIEPFWNSWDKAKTLSVPDVRLLDGLEFLQKAQEDKAVWLVDNWICAGTVHLLAGPQKIGKSTVLHSLIPAVIKGEAWFRRVETVQSHVLYLDWENSPGYVGDNLLSQCSIEDYTKYRQWLHVPEALPPALTAAWLKKMLEKIEAQSGIIIIDSAYAAFNALFGASKGMAWENIGSQVRSVLDPITAVVRDTKWAVIIIAHDNKSGGTAGSAQWEAAVDAILHYKVQASYRVLEAKYGRWSKRKPSSLAFQKPAERLELIGTSADLRDREAKEETDGLLSCIPSLELDTVPTADNTISQSELIELTGLSQAEVSKQLGAFTEIRKEKFSSGKGRATVRYWQLSQLA